MTTFDIKDPQFGAVGDGTADDRPALERALAAAKPGDTVLVPAGSYRIVLTGGAISIPKGVTILGTEGESRFLLGSNGGPGAYREFLSPGADVTIEGVGIQRDANFSGILLPIRDGANNFTVRNCQIDGQLSRFSSYLHCFRVGDGTVANFTLAGSLVEDFVYGLFQSSDATGTLDGVLVENCRFERNAATDLEFNSPSGVMRNIVVRDSAFSGNASDAASGGFAVGFANVTNGRVENCRIEGYGSEALHVEDRSENIELIGNTIIGGSLVQPWGVIMIISGSKRVTIADNLIDGRPNQNSPQLVLVTAGGPYQNPSEVSVTRNVLINGAKTNSWYLQEGSGYTSSNLEFEFGSTIPAEIEARLQGSTDPGTDPGTDPITGGVYLSDLTPTASTNGWGAYERDRSNGEQAAGDGGTLTINGTTYAKGLGVHATSSLTYNLGGSYSSFQSFIGIDDEVRGSNGSVVFRVLADGEQIFKSATLTGASAPELVDLNVAGVQSLQLIVDNADGSIDYDHANWADAKLGSAPWSGVTQEVL
jgi:hypothetical protein